MANTLRFLVAATSLWLVLASGALTPAAADSHSLTPDALQYSVMPPPVDDVSQPTMDLIGQPVMSGGGSASAAAVDAAGHTMPDGAFPEEPITEALDRAQPPVDEPAVAPAATAVAVPATPAAATTAVAATTPAVTNENGSYPVVVTPQVAAFLERFTTSRREIITLWLSRSRQYLGMIREVFRTHGLPEDLAFVAMIESGFNPIAVSHAGAKGLWQFMADTGRRYGLRVDQWVDERYDPEKSTGAAAAYFKDLYRQFGSWSLAKAAYNAGEMKIVNAIRGVGSSDFWALASSRFLKDETKNFVPAIHAATLIGRDPGGFGFDPPELKPVDTDTVSVPASTNIAKIASRSGIALETLKSLNPVLVRGITPPGGPYELTVPAGSQRAVRAALAPPASKSVARTSKKGPAPVASRPPARSTVHVVKPRETVTSIARLYGVSVREVQRWNGLGERHVLRPGDRLRVADTQLAAERLSSVGAR
jgi:membrane-bound lytic murein transglycosylase D